MQLAPEAKRALVVYVVLAWQCFFAKPLGAEVLLDVNGITVSDMELQFYLKERLRPEVYESALVKPDALRNAVVNRYVVRRAAAIAIEEQLVSEGEVVYRQQDGGLRLALQAYVADRTAKALEATDWDALARERYIAEQDQYGQRQQVDVSHILIKSEGRDFNQLVEQVALVQSEIDAGEDFNALAERYSEDESAELNAGNIGFIDPGQTDPNFEGTAFAMTEVGSVSGPVLTSFGVHFIRYNGRRTAESIPFESLKSRLIKSTKKTREQELRGEILAPFRGEAWPLVEALDETSLADRLLERLLADN